MCAPVVPGSSQHVCAPPVVKQIGDFCADPGSLCPAGAFCAAIEGGAAQCQEGRDVGKACDMNAAQSQCKSDLRCTTDGVCAERLGPGEGCATDADCGSQAPYCDTSLAVPVCDAGVAFSVGAPACRQYGAGQAR
jgi:hypothetical protein